MVEKKKRKRITQSGKKLRHHGRTLDLKANDLIGPD